MTRKFGELSLASLHDLPLRCRGCVYWELSPADRAIAIEHDPEFEKEAWLSGVCLEVGSAGKVLSVDGTPAGYALLGDAALFARASFFPARVSKDALFLATAHILPEWQGRGHGKALIQTVLKTAKERNKRAIECFADRQWSGPDCLLPAEFCERVGFKVKRDHVRFPLMRIDVRSLAKVKDTAAAAVEELLESLGLAGAEPAVRPAR